MEIRETERPDDVSVLRNMVQNDVKQIEEIVERLRDLFRLGRATVDGEHLVLDSLAECRAFIVSYQARATAILGRVKGIYAKGKARLKIVESKAYIDIRRGRGKNTEEEDQGGKTPSQKDAEIIAQAKAGSFAMELAEWEGILARISGANDTLKSYGDAIKEIGWFRRAEESL